MDWEGIKIMNNKGIRFYDFDDEDTMVLYNLEEKNSLSYKKNKPYKNLIINSLLISVFLFFLCFGFGYIQTKRINNLKASAVKKEEFNVEKLNKYSNKLKEYEKTNNKYEILINKSNQIKEEDISNYEIVSVKDNIYTDISLEKKTYESYLKLKENLLSRGYFINIRSGFRTFLESKSIYDSYSKKYGLNYAEKYVAQPGTSEHNTGLALDFIISNDKNGIKTNYDSDEYFYLENIAYLYGFIIRYPKDKESITGYSYEPWHLRYVGKDLAKYLKKNNLTLEEYYETKE